MDTNKIREAMERIVNLRYGPDGDCGAIRIAEEALAELDKAQQPGKVLTDEEIDGEAVEYALRVLRLAQEKRTPDDPRTVHESFVISAWASGFRYARDNGYLAPAAGLTVEEVMELVDKWTSVWVYQYVEFRMEQDLRARLTAAINAKQPTA